MWKNCDNISLFFFPFFPLFFYPPHGISFFFFFPLSTSSVTPMQELIQLQNVPLSAWIEKLGWLEPTTIVLRSNQTPLYCARTVEQPPANFRLWSPSSFSIFFPCSWLVVVSDFRFVRSASIFFFLIFYCCSNFFFFLFLICCCCFDFRFVV